MAQNKGISALFRKSNKNVLVALSSQIILDFGKLGLQMKHEGPHSTMDFLLASHPAAPGSNPGITKKFS